MLVLTRKEGESIIISGDIQITVMNIGQGRVKIGINAPKSVEIDRAEIHDKKTADDTVVGLEAVDASEHSGPTSMTPAQIVNRVAEHQARPAKPRNFPRKPR